MTEEDLRKERERCAKVCDSLAGSTSSDDERRAARSLADRIRNLPDNDQTPVDPSSSDGTVRKLPVRTELIVLTVDDPDERKLGFTMYERDGVEVHVYDPDVRPEEVNESELKPITSKGGLQEGARILVPSLMGGFLVMDVERDGDGGLLANGDGVLAILEYGTDERACWTCVGLVNSSVFGLT